MARKKKATYTIKTEPAPEEDLIMSSLSFICSHKGVTAVDGPAKDGANECLLRLWATQTKEGVYKATPEGLAYWLGAIMRTHHPGSLV